MIIIYKKSINTSCVVSHSSSSSSSSSMMLKLRLIRSNSLFRKLSTTSPVRETRAGLGLDHLKLTSFLIENNVISSDSTLSIQQFAHGQSNPTYILSTEHQDIVLRKQPPGKLLRGAHAIDREYRIMRALKSSDVPVPKLLLFCEDSNVLGTPWYCYDYVPGRFLKDPSLPEIAHPNERKSIYTHMIQTLAKLHSVDIDAVGLSDYGVRREASADNLPYVIR
jgi:acyl-CoA dehydrogenase family protein 10